MRSSRTDSGDLFSALAAIYRDADAAFDGWSCPASTECCRFAVTGREPYVTSIELAALLRAAPDARKPRVSDRAPARRQLAGAPVRDERRCPLLSAEGRCTAYNARPLGCRTYYCERAIEGGRVKHRVINELVRRVQEVAAQHEPGGDLGRPLTRALGLAKR